MSGHPDIEELWLDLVEGTLPEGQAREVRAHLEACEGCRARFRKLEAAHQVSLRAGRILARDEAPPIPPALEAAVLREARATPRPRRRRAWLAGALVAAAAAAALLLVRSGRREAPDVAWLRGTLAALVPPPGVRGRGDAVASAAEAAELRWRGGALSPRGARLRCPQGEVTVGALVASRGDVALLAARIGERTDVHVYGEDGAELGAARVVAGARSDHALPPLPHAAAREIVERGACPPGTPATRER